MKKAVSSILAVALMVCLSCYAYAGWWEINANNVHIREGAGTDYVAHGQVNKGDT